MASAADTTMVVVTRAGGLHAGQQGRPAGDRRHLRHQQGGPARCPRGAAGPRADAGSVVAGALAPAHRRDGRPTGEGLAALWDEVARHRAHLRQVGDWSSGGPTRLGHELRRVLMARSAARIDELASRARSSRRAVKALAAGRARPLPGRRPAAGTIEAPTTRFSYPAAWLNPTSTVERRADGVALVRLDRPKANALSVDVLRQSSPSPPRCTDDPPGAVVLWGGERIFAAGAEIAELAAPARPTGGRRLPRAPWAALAACPGPPSPPSTATPWGVGWSWPWPATSGCVPRMPSSGSPRSCSGSSPAAAARSGCRA